MAEVHGTSTDSNVPGVLGENSAQGGRGVVGNGVGAAGIGVLGQNDLGVAVYGNSRLGAGVVGESQQPNGWAVLGENRADGGRGVVGRGFTATGIGVLGENGAGDAVFGNSGNGRGVVGVSNLQAGVVGDSQHFDGVFGASHTAARAGVSGHNLNPDGSPNPNGLAGFFDGNVTINGNLTCSGDVQLLVPNQECAEDFEVSGAEEIGAGSVVVIDSIATLKQSDKAYDKRVAGVISGALDYRPGVILGRQQPKNNGLPVALVGRVYCKVDAAYSPVEVGDLLTTSPTPGHAMKANDPIKAFGAVIGKALDCLGAGRGLIPILVALQ
jgi:hypothetical protein